jgi:hypothetical protein
MRHQHGEAAARIRELTEYPIMSLDSNPTEKYVPPRTGTLVLKVVDGYKQKEKFQTISSCDQKYAADMASCMGDVGVLSHAMQNSKIRLQEALDLYKVRSRKP